MSRAIRMLALVSLGLPCIAACTRSAHGYYGTTQPKHGPDEAWTNLSTEPEYIDPGKCSDSAGGTIIVNLFAGLTQAHPVTLAPMPDVARSWTISEDGRRYVFQLRPSIWSDGVALTAHDFEYSWKRVLDPATASKYVTFLYPLRYAEMFQRRAILVRGVEASGEAALRARIEAIASIESLRWAADLGGCFVLLDGDEQGRAAARERVIRALDGVTLAGATLHAALTDASVVGVRAADDYTLVVDLENPVPYFLDLVKFYTALPVPRHVIERLAREGKNPDLWTRPEHIVSNGAYRLSEWKFRQFMRLQKNARYWDAQHVRMPSVRLAMVESYNTTLNLYEAGELDAIGPNSSLPAEFMDQLSRYRDFRRAPTLASYFYWFNTNAAPVNDARVRRALSLAIDRKSLVEHVSRGGQIPSADLVPDQLGGYVGPHSPLFDPEAARALLREAGYGPGHPLPPLTLTYNTTEAHKQLAEAVQQMWKQNLGVTVELENQEWKVYLKNLQSMSFQIARMGWVGDYPDPNTFLELLTSHNGNNHAGWHDAHYDDLLKQANATTEHAARMQKLQDAERYVLAAMPILPLYVYSRSELVKPYLMGHALNYETRYLCKYWWIDRRWYDGVPSTRLSEDFPAKPTHSATSHASVGSAAPSAGASQGGE
jgi:oligopeptide transport system substrate-binding protein